MRARRADLYLYCSAVAAVVLLSAAQPFYWDSFGYVVQAISGQVGGLGFGRPVFIALSHVIARAWFAAGGSAMRLEPVLRVWWALVSCLAAPLTWRLARRVGLSDRASAMAGLAVAVSPAFAHAAGSVLTDGPATSMCVLASLFGVSAVLDSREASGFNDERREPRRRAVVLALAAGGAIGIAIGLREQSVLAAAGLAVLLPIARRDDRWRLGVAAALAGLVVVATPMLWVWLSQPGYPDTIRTWLRGMAHDRAVMTFGWSDASLYLLWILSLGPVVVITALSAWARRSSPVWRVRGALFAVSAPAILQLLIAAAFRGISYSPRFLLPGFPAALAIPGAWAIDRAVGESRIRFVGACVLIVLPLIVAAPIVRERSAPTAEALEALPGLLRTIPADAVIVTGEPCPTIALARAVVAHDDPTRAADWQPVCPGWAWPSDLRARLDSAQREGRTVVLDLRPAAWVGAEQMAALSEAQQYVAEAGWPAVNRRLVVWR